VLNQYGTFNCKIKKTMDDLGCAYLYCELLYQVSLIMITLRVKSPHIQMHENVFQQRLYVKVENFGIEIKSPRGFVKRNMPIIFIGESTTIVSSITRFEPTFIPMFFHYDSFKKFKSRSL